MSRPRLVDLFSGAGGAGMGYHRAGFDVVGANIATLDTGEYTDDSEYYGNLPDRADPARVADVIAARLTRPVARDGRFRRLVVLDESYGIGFADEPEA